MNFNFLKRRFIIGLSANGAVFIRDAEAGPDKEFAKYALPVYSTDTREEADAIVVRKCYLSRDNDRYVWPGVVGNIDVLDDISKEMAKIHVAQMGKGKR